ncbi:hypothetical protein ACFL52_05290 [Candidatus Margulisiibacteriota bacterium]
MRKIFSLPVKLILIPLLLLQLFSLECLAEVAASAVGSSQKSSTQKLSAVERVKRLVDYQREEQIKKGTVGTLLGTVGLVVGIPMLRGYGALGGILFLGAGVALLYGGVWNLFFSLNTVETDYNRIINVEFVEREKMAAEYLKEKTLESEENQQDHLNNLFGLLPRPETRERKEYQKYVEGLSVK